MNSANISIHSFPEICSHQRSDIQDYLIKKKLDTVENTELDITESTHYFAYKEPIVSVFQPQACVFEFMSENELDVFLNLEEESEVKKIINSKMDIEVPKGEPREIFISMILNVRKWCKKSKFDLRKTGAILSIFYFTHTFVTSKFDLSPHKVFYYFKELLFSHSLPFPPYKIKLFDFAETKSISEFFYKIYLRNLPLLRLLCLPNFAFYLQYDLREEDDKSIEQDEPKAKEKKVGKTGKGKKSRKSGKSSRSKSKSPGKKKKG